MRTLYNWFGGRALLNNDLEAMQEQLFQQASAHYNRGAYLISGGAITAVGGGLYNIAEALIVINNQLVLMPAQTSVSLTATTVVVQTTTVNMYPRPFAILSSVLPGVKKTVAQVKELSTVAVGSGEYLKITPNGFMRTHIDAQRDAINLVREMKYYAGSTSSFDSNGAGIGVLRGWQICNGNNGSIDLRGRNMVAYLAGDANFGTIGATGGNKQISLGVNNIPSHNHAIEAAGNHNHLYDQPQIGVNASPVYYLSAMGSIPYGFSINTSGTVSNIPKHDHSGSTGDTGNGDPISLLNPYAVISCVLIWIGNGQYHGSI